MKRDIVAESKILRYEFYQLCGAATELRNGGHSQTIHNALVESFVMHVRNLYEFFVQPSGDALSALHYFSTPEEWHRCRGKVGQRLQKACERARTEVAHITSERKNLNFPGGHKAEWFIDGSEEDFAQFLDRFLSIVDKSKLDPAVEAGLQRYRTTPAPATHQTIVSSGLQINASTASPPSSHQTTTCNTISPQAPFGPPRPNQSP